MFTQLPRVLSFIPSSFATTATGRDVSITIFTASSLNSGEKLLFLGRVKIIYLPGIILMDDCPGSSGHLSAGHHDRGGGAAFNPAGPWVLAGVAGLGGECLHADLWRVLAAGGATG